MNVDMTANTAKQNNKKEKHGKEIRAINDEGQEARCAQLDESASRTACNRSKISERTRNTYPSG